jgi:hypothetical protein
LVAETNLARFLAAIAARPPATPSAIALAENDLQKRLPEHYRNFLMEANGGERALGEEGYVALWQVGELGESNLGYSVEEFAPGLLLVGSDGGDMAYALDLRREGAPVVTLPFIPMSLSLVEDVGPGISDLLAAIESGTA